MKNLFTKLLTILILFVPFTLAQAAVETYSLDPTHSYILWHANHFGFSNLSGKWMAQGTLQLDEAKPANSSINITINTADLVTGIPKLDEHLTGKDFFDVKKFPTATFVSDKVEVTGKDTAKVHGALTVHGISKPVTLNIKLNKIGVSAITQKKTAGFTGNTTLKRSDFGVGAYAPNVSDEVKIEIEAEAYVETAAAKAG